MSTKYTPFRNFLEQLRSSLTPDKAPGADYEVEEPLRSELFTSDQMRKHSQFLAQTHKLRKTPLKDRLLPRLDDNEKVLREVRNLLVNAVKDEYLITPAGEWLLDNFYLVEEQIRITKKHLPKLYSEGLPQLEGGPVNGLPRVYDIALEIISHSDGRVDLEILNNFLEGYQSASFFQLGELWAVPIMLRLALIENLRRASARIAVDRINRNLADYWADRLIETSENDPKNLILIIADMARSNPPLERAFVAEFTRKLRGTGASLAPALHWVEERLAEAGHTSQEMVHSENQKQAADQVSVSNSIGSLKVLGDLDWREFVETNSIIERILREDPVYIKMDFGTRDQYRQSVERVAKYSKLPEPDIARLAVDLAQSNQKQYGATNRSAHIGYFLIDDGLRNLEQLAEINPPLLMQLRRGLGRFPLALYLGGILLISLAVSALVTYKAYADKTEYWLIALVALLSLITASQLAVALVNFLSSLIVHPSFLARMNFSTGIPEEYKTLVVIPVLLAGEEQIEELVEGLEVRFLANRSPNLYYALLTDFADSKEQHVPGDELLTKLVQTKIEALNREHAGEGAAPFFLFHRPRLWNEQEKIWMGYERKRGKLSDINALLRGNTGDRFSLITGDVSQLSNVKFVLTLDSDTKLPRDTAWKMIGTLAHPLNHAVYDEKKQRVVKGYGILQPRVTVSLPEADSSLFTRLNSNEPGIDPYTLLTSDVYQDVFGEGSFVGKGIYDIDTFEKVLSNRFPDNRILSHDLLEGCFIRSGFISDVQLYEKFPDTYQADMQRRHRWTRGDWQVAAWFTPFVPTKTKKWTINRLSLLSRWKLFDNVRRSLVPAAMIVFILLSWTLMPYAAVWTLMITGFIIVPVIITAAWDLIRKPKDLILSHHLILSSRSAGSGAVRAMIVMIALPYEAYVNMDAILRTLWRMCISRRHLLQWRPASLNLTTASPKLFNSYSAMWLEPTLGVAELSMLLYFSLPTLEVAGPILFLWMISPYIMWRISKAAPRERAMLEEEDVLFLQRTARRTWSFFERFVTADENWLPPDNYQESPVEVVAHRTSPTNIGLSLLANLAAHDFGYISTGELIQRTSDTLYTINRMDKYRGHLYNWYDTQTLATLPPRYVSTVDSGNLAAHLLTLRQGLLEMPEAALADRKWFRGLMDTLEVLAEIDEGRNEPVVRKVIVNVSEVLKNFQPHLWFIHDELIKLKQDLAGLRNSLSAPNESETSRWIEKSFSQVQKLIDELELCCPWLTITGLPESIKELPELNSIPTLHTLSLLKLPDETKQMDTGSDWQAQLNEAVHRAVENAKHRLSGLDELSEMCEQFADIDYDFLYNSVKHLTTIGYNADEHRTDASFYDLLASEARLSTFLGIAQGKLPQQSWFALGRLLTNAGGRPILLSWSGSMFEYLMPMLVMPSYNNTLLDQTDKAAVKQQIEHGKLHKIPWGISESGYNAVDSALNYQYRAFGVPGLGLKRGLSEDLVIAPYATMLALMVYPAQAVENLKNMSNRGFIGKYGFYEAIDFTPARLPQGQTEAIVRSYMAHHHGMSFLSIAHLLLNKPMQRRFETDPRFQATLLLLQERIPKATSLFVHTSNQGQFVSSVSEPQTRIITSPHTPVPEVQLLSNGTYHVMVTNSGGGYSRYRDIAITRWREDTTRDHWGTFCYIRDLKTGRYWSNAFQPTHQKATNYTASFSQGRADFSGTVEEIDTHTEIVVSPEDNIEMRRLHITNRSGKTRVLDITSYTEIVLTPAIADAMHPAFGNLFVQTEILEDKKAILCTRRPRSKEEKPPFAFLLMNMHGKDAEEISYETDRNAFIGRGRTVANPQVIECVKALTNSQGSVLDPIASVQYKITLAPDEAIILDMIIGIGDTREAALALIDKYQDKHHKDRVFELAWTHNQVILKQINAAESEAQLYTRLAGSVIYANSLARGEASVLIKNRRGQSALWPYTISGDLPIVLLKVEEQYDIDIIQQLVQAHTFWSIKGLACDLIIWNDSRDVYRQNLQNQISSFITTPPPNQRGNIFVRNTDQIANEDRILFQTVARVVINSSVGSLADHVNRKWPTRTKIPMLTATPAPVISSAHKLTIPTGLQFFNGTGGFSADGREYIMILGGKTTPVPWINVIANPNFGTIISERGSSYTWHLNAHEMRLTPWENDPVSDGCGEAIYLRDEETGYYWSPFPNEVNESSTFIVRHGAGYSVFEHEENGIHSELWIFVDLEAPVKFMKLKVKNNSGRVRNISATGYAEWVLGDLRSKSSMYIVTESDPDTKALLAHNPYNTEFPDLVAFLDCDGPELSHTTDRGEFIGRNSSLHTPEALLRTKLSGKTGVGFDTCAALQSKIKLAPGQEREITFKLGQGNNADDARRLIRNFRNADSASNSLQEVIKFWNETIDQFTVSSPAPEVDLLVNGWLTYQTLACRVWGRSGFYQSGGAFGFRDQLQDVISLLDVDATLARKQILLAASRQFTEGDVQHWWHPGLGRGVRTTCSDDYLWLPYVCSRYIKTTGDHAILDEQVSFLEGRGLNPGEESYYDIAVPSVQSASLYEHCVRAVKHGFRFGVHGLPLIGSGDWNDGMDRVGKEGKGESVWLAFFLYDVLQKFSPVAKLKGDSDFENQCTAQAASIKESVYKNAWDGEWYLRAYFDDGSPLGSHVNTECTIDSIAQSWATLSGAGESGRNATALQSALKYLVREKDGIVQLLNPPFNASNLDPGYIKGYAPGTRENGGQYTHSAIWLTMAFAAAKDPSQVWNLLSIINPINHAKTPEGVLKYKAEPYVMAADVYGVAPHTGRGGWTWYTGSAGWMNQLLVHSFLGINREGDKLSFNPCVPPEWHAYQVRYRFGKTYYDLNFVRNESLSPIIIKVNGAIIDSGMLLLIDDEQEHKVEIKFS